LRALAGLLRAGREWDEALAAPHGWLKGGRAAEAARAIAEATAQGIEEWDHRTEEQILRFYQMGVEIRCLLDDDYPPRLFDLRDPPPLLYSRGDFSLLSRTKGVAVIGARESTSWGDGVARRLGAALARRSYNVVSGLALGIDTAAHRGALDEGGATTAVIVDVVGIYPERNAELAEEIVRGGGLLLAEHPPGTSATRGHLVARDRIQSALSVAVFPVETAVTGGTVHTLRFAAAQRRPVFCLAPEELHAHSTPAFHEGIAKIVREGAAVYRVAAIDDMAGSLTAPQEPATSRRARRAAR
jgi:DNA processing protein